MEKLDVLMINAGEVIHFHGKPVQLMDHARVLGRKENFNLDQYGMFVVNAVLEGEPAAK